VSPVWLSAPISAAFQRYVQGIGPVNVKGTLVIPIFQLPASDGAGSPYYSTASIYPKFSVGQLGGPLTVPPGFGNDGLTWTLAPVPAWSTNGTVIGPTELNLYYLPFLAHRRMLFLNNQSKYLLTQWNLLHKKFSQGELVTKCFVHAHNAACGTVSAMLSKVAVVPGDTSNAFPPVRSNPNCRILTGYEDSTWSRRSRPKGIPLTLGTETSKYQEERKSTETLLVVASERRQAISVRSRAQATT
jgi:hypothetical protein